MQVTGGNYQVSTLCQANPEFYTRTGQITLRNAAGHTQTITVVQAKGVTPFLYAAENPVYLPNDTFGARLIPVYSNVDWTLSPSNLGNGWLTFVTAIDTVHVPDEPCLGFIYLRYKQNLTDTLRYSYVILNNSLIKDTVYIYQGPDISATQSPNESIKPVRCFPNPARSGHFTVEFYAAKNAPYTLEVFSLSGQVIARQEVFPGSDTFFRAEMDLPRRSNGMYLVRALSPSVGYIGKIVIQWP
ncbi:MAG: T9SS type A sorting domain-containing protein [Lewinellaceae bacterium]|nr:T9SS type A sorting domain-containing protein [Lewinellaceae bacterium]